MKNALLLTITIASSAMTLVTQVEQHDIDSTCKVLYYLSDDAINTNQVDLLDHYLCTYYEIDNKYKVDEIWSNYFHRLDSTYEEEILDHRTRINYPITSLPKPGGGSFTHKELEVLVADVDLSKMMVAKLKEVNFKDKISVDPRRRLNTDLQLRNPRVLEQPNNRFR